MLVFIFIVVLFMILSSVVNFASAKYDEKIHSENNQYEELRKKKAMFLQPLPGSGTGHSRSKK